jgi:hypothetical protein
VACIATRQGARTPSTAPGGRPSEQCAQEEAGKPVGAIELLSLLSDQLEPEGRLSPCHTGTVCALTQRPQAFTSR